MPVRDYQIRELTRGQEIPLSPIPPRVLGVIVEKLFTTWDALLLQYADIMGVVPEAELNALLDARLNYEIGADTLFGSLVLCVVRGKETAKFDGSKLEKRPDISLVLTGRPTAFPLSIECKIIEKAKGKTVSLYCNNGLKRFVDGDYSWHGPEALMLGYVRDGSKIDTTLSPFLMEAQKMMPDPFETVQLPSGDAGKSTLRHSRHDRHFAYLNGGQPGPIDLWHIWVEAAPWANINQTPV